MTALPNIDMQEATRLTREGRLHEAMAILQGRKPPGPEAEPTGSDQDASQEPIDMDPPTPANGGIWTLAGQPRTATASRGRATSARTLGELLSARLRSVPLADVRRPGPVVEPTLPEGARFERRSFTAAGASRRYRLYLPANVARGTASDRLPLVVMLHGCTQSPEDFALGTGMNRLAEAQGFLVAYPGQSLQANSSSCWNWFNAADQQRGRGEPALIAGITREVMAEYPVDPARVYVAGLSAGGAAAAIMARAYPDLYAAVGVHSGLACGAASDLGSAFSAMRQGGQVRTSTAAAAPFPTIIFHGDRDVTVHPVNGEQVADQARAGHHLAVQSSRGRAVGGGEYTRRLETDATGKPVVEHWILHGAGHAWSGGDAAGSYTDARGPDASAAMVRFFSQQTLVEAGAP